MDRVPSGPTTPSPPIPLCMTTQTVIEATNLRKTYGNVGALVLTFVICTSIAGKIFRWE